MSTDEKSITVESLIERLQQLPTEAKSLPVYAGYDGFCATPIYDAYVATGRDGQPYVRLIGD